MINIAFQFDHDLLHMWFCWIFSIYISALNASFINFPSGPCCVLSVIVFQVSNDFWFLLLYFQNSWMFLTSSSASFCPDQYLSITFSHFKQFFNSLLKNKYSIYLGHLFYAAGSVLSFKHKSYIVHSKFRLIIQYNILHLTASKE